MGDHINTKREPKRKRKFNEDSDARWNRVNFKSYLQQLEEDLLEQELEDLEEDDTAQDE